MPIEVDWEVAANERFDPVFKKGSSTTSPLRDYTVKVDVKGLNPASQYYYRFKALNSTSPTGKTKTLPEGNTDRLKFAVVSCSNWQHGYFNAYNRIAEKDPKAHSYQPLAVEFGRTSITSANANESTPDDTVKLMEQVYIASNPHLKFVNRRDHGYLLLTLYPEKAKAEWFYVATLLRPDDAEQLAKTLEVNLNSNTLH